MTVNIYGIDLAEDLNYCGIIVGAVDSNSVHLAGIRKFNKVRYPQIRMILRNDLFPKLPPTKVVTDYTNNRDFSQEVEAEMNPLFLNPNTPYYNKWKFIKPYIFSPASKLALFQNMRKFLEHGGTPPRERESFVRAGTREWRAKRRAQTTWGRTPRPLPPY